MSKSCFIHVDLDAFYASVEQLDNPEYKGKPVIVGGLPHDRRGVVSTCSYEARAYGVHSAMPIVQAVKLCPNAIFLRGRMKRYQERSKEVMSIFSDFSPDIHQISVDEAFIDISGTERLFGKPIDVAKRLKETVYEKTGLTVSVGISTTKYIAKIASGIRKPDGLFIVEDGDEENFMQNLPIKDIWGIGQKTLARIKEAGFFSSKEVHKASLGILVSLFGNSTGTFLYNAVRGTVYETFNEAPKTKSISSERTFSFDLTDRYAIETALMELSWDVMFRLFTEKWTSKTAHIKIRYEDFTTVSIQETTTHSISSADDLFTRVKKLFEKKYENGRGVRLIGIAAQNLEDTTLPVQQELFDTGNKKKITVEKTIIEIQKKNPTISIGKARLMKNTLLTSLAFFLTFFAMPQHSYSQEQEPVIELAKPFEDAFISGEAPIAIFNLSEDSSQIEFFAQGTWEAELQGFLNVAGGNNDSGENEGINFSFEPPIFMQKTDLTVWFLLQDTWYFEAAVADDYEESTVAAGYYGENFLKHARIGNRHITFSQDYGVTDADRGVGSGSNQAPGIMTEFSGSNWKADAIVRYDMTESMEKTWLGQNELTENTIALNQWQKGARFILPENTAQNISAIFVESENKDEALYKDSEGIVYKKLSASDYLIIPSKNMIVFNTPTSNNILVQFTGTTPSLGTFSPADGFLGNIQNVFGDDILLGNFSLNNFFTRIDGNNALILQKKNFFSPFIDASLYALSSFSEVESVKIISESSTISEKNYGSVLIDASPEVPGFTDTDYFEEKATYIQVYNQVNSAQFSQFPFADKFPLLYLSPSSSTQIIQGQSDTIILVQSFSSASVLDIGTNAIPGSINVYRNGIRESLFSYDSNTGIVTLTSEAGTFDTIRITWTQNNETATTGSLVAAVGFERFFSPELAMNASTSVLWPIVEKDAFSDSSLDAGGSVNVAFDINYKKDSLTIDNTLLNSFQKADVTDTYRVLGMDGSNIQEYYLSSDAAITLPNNFVPTLNARTGETVPPQLNANEKGTSEAAIIKDTAFSGYVINNDWNIENSNGWIAQSIDLSDSTTNLPSAETFSIYLKHDTLPSNYSVYLQLGVSSDEEELFEQQAEIPTWELTSTSINSDVQKHFNTTNENWQKVTVKLKNEDRAKLAIHQNARIIIVGSNGSTAKQGTLQIGPFEILGSAFSLQGEGLEGEEVWQVQSGKAENNAMKQFNTDDTNFVQFFSWDDSSGQTMIASQYIEELALNSYNNLSFFTYIPNAPTDGMVTLTLERDTEYGTKTALQIRLQQTALEKLQQEWHEVSINLQSKEVYIDSEKLSSTYYKLTTVDTSIAPTRITLEFEGSGSMYFDELYLSESLWEYNVENIFDIAWSKNEVILEAHNIPIFANPSVSSNVEAGVAVSLNDVSKATQIGAVTDTNAQIDIIGIRTEGAIRFSSSNNSTSLSNTNSSFYLESASHKIASTPTFKIMEIIGFEEDYRYLPQSNGAKKIEYFKLDFSPLGVKIHTDFLTEASQENYLYTQDVSISNTIHVGENALSYSASTSLFAEQQGYTKELLDATYGKSWLDISSIQFSSGNSDSDKRNTGFSFFQEISTFRGLFAPSLLIEGTNNYLQSNEHTNTANDTIKIMLPFSIKNHQISTSFTKKSFIDTTRSYNANYADDAYYYITQLQNRQWAYTTIPFYDFYDPTIYTKMQNTITDISAANVAGYSSEWGIDWQRAFFSNLYDFFVPSSASLFVSRNIRASAVDASDILQVSSNVQFLSLNNFGLYGSNQIFTWYQQDEIMQSLKIAYESDTFDKSNWRLNFSAYSQVSLYFSDSNTLTVLGEGQIDTAKAWNIKLDAVWKRNGTSSFIVDSFYAIFPSLLKENKGFTRENSLYFGFSKNTSDENNSLSQFYGIDHDVEVSITDFAKIGFNVGSELYIEKDYFTLQNSLSLIGKLEF